ncbi:hypothetical protein [Kitasatospora sp. NPDC059673]|uniref:hypothetical protein n=1 Tax=Kitasatospora sp. NPDC059673 TaxID=3346901 RepID=UPI0036996D7C
MDAPLPERTVRDLTGLLLAAFLLATALPARTAAVPAAAEPPVLVPNCPSGAGPAVGARNELAVRRPPGPR